MIENEYSIEKDSNIELSDKEYAERSAVLRGIYPQSCNVDKKSNDEPFKVSKEMQQEGWVYKELPPEEEMSPALKEKFKKAKKICQNTKVIDLREAQPAATLMHLEMTELEESIKREKKNERQKSKTPEKRTKKANPKSNEAAVENIQA